MTPTIYAGCMAPYDLGLNTPRDICLLIDVEPLSELWGPGTSRFSSQHREIWKGGGIEFYSPFPIEVQNVAEVIELKPCGDRHR